MPIVTVIDPILGYNSTNLPVGDDFGSLSLSPVQSTSAIVSPATVKTTNHDPLEERTVVNIGRAALSDDKTPTAQITPRLEPNGVSRLNILALPDSLPLSDHAQAQAIAIAPIPETLSANSSENPTSLLLRQADLVGRFGRLELPDTIEFGDLGGAQVIVTNKGNAIAQGSLMVNLYLSPDGDLDQNDVLVASQTQNLTLRSGESTSLQLAYQNITSAIAPGAYHLIAQIDANHQIAEGNEDNNIASKSVSAPGTDVVIDWNAAALNAIQAQGEADLAAGTKPAGVPPTDGSRLMAIASTAVYDTVNAFTQAYTPYAVNWVAPQGASLEAAVVGAAYRALVTLLPEQAPLLGQQLMQSLAEIQDSRPSEMAGFMFGQSVADQILALRADDGSDNTAPYVSPEGDYVWHPDAPDFIAIGANWGQVTPFAIPSVSAFATDGLDGTPTQNPTLYAQEIEEVRAIGGRNNTDLSAIARTPDQTELAFFWSYDRADTFRPYGQLNQITQEIAVREGNSLAENARLFAALNVALADAAIVAWDAKYTYTQPRPDDVIAGGIAAHDGLEATIADPDWKPLLDTPPFPDYLSGHSSFAGAWAGVLTNFFGDYYPLTLVSQELPGVTRSFSSFYDAADEDAISRVYGGVHVREATITDALPMGLNVGQFVAENFFQLVA